MIKKGTKAYKEQYVRIYYGIDHTSLQVESVWERQDGRLDGKGIHHYPAGRTAQNELVVVFGLRDIRSVPITMDTTRTREDLEARAAELRAERDAKEEE